VSRVDHTHRRPMHEGFYLGNRLQLTEEVLTNY
jgi:hypothetical protein